jgi:ketosteroid isomerase-like protein
MRRITFVSVVCLALLCLPAMVHAGVADEVIAVTYAQWAADMANDTAKATEIMADDYTEFNSGFPTRIDGKALNVRLAEANAQASGSLLAAEMANPKVQVYGDVAILTYNFFGISKNADGETSPILAKSTRVYAKQGGKWMLVHANFAPVGDED